MVKTEEDRERRKVTEDKEREEIKERQGVGTDGYIEERPRAGIERETEILLRQRRRDREQRQRRDIRYSRDRCRESEEICT